MRKLILSAAFVVLSVGSAEAREPGHPRFPRVYALLHGGQSACQPTTAPPQQQFAPVQSVFAAVGSFRPFAGFGGCSTCGVGGCGK